MADGRPRRLTAIGEITTVQAATLAWLRARIADGAFEEGARLRQEALAREAGVSIPPVREALQTLESEGQVVYVPRRGYFLAKLSLPELAEAYQIRELLETEAVRRAVGQLRRDDLERMRFAMMTMERAHHAGDIAALTEANRAFHFTLFDAAEMPRMSQMIRVLWDATDRYRSRYFAFTPHRRRVNSEHRAIMTAVAAGDASAAVRLLRKHREHALDALSTALQGAAPLSQPPARTGQRRAGSDISTDHNSSLVSKKDIPR